MSHSARRAKGSRSIPRVPLGKRELPGIVWERVAGPAPEAQALKPIRQALAALPPLSSAWRQLVGFAASYYQRSLGELALAVLPPELRKLDATQLDRRLKRLQKTATASSTASSKGRSLIESL